MREVTKVFKVYQYDELSTKSQAVAYQNWYRGADPDTWDAEYKKIMKIFEDVFYCKIEHWEVGTSRGEISFRVFSRADDGMLPEEAVYAFDDKKRVRISKYIMARFTAFYPTDPSKNDGCPFTGFCGDYPINEILKKVFSFETLYDSYREFLQDAVREFLSEWAEDRGYQVSEEAFKEIVGEDEYLEDGKKWEE